MVNLHRHHNNNNNNNIREDDEDVETIPEAASASESIPQRSTITSIKNSRDIKDLKSEVKELKQLLKLSFEVQLDMQRSLKQEISALIAGTWSNSASANLVKSSRTSNEGKCVICTEQGIDVVFYECGHMCSCFVCAQSLRNKGLNCPVCRAPIKDIVRAYKVGLMD